MSKTIHFFGRISGITGLLIALFLLDLALGSVWIPPDQIFRILIGLEPDQASWETIFWQIRFPRALTAVFAGAALALSGLLMQSFFQNPIAGPFVLGISSGSSLGVAILVLGSSTLGLGRWISPNSGWSLILFSSLGAFLVLLIVLQVARSVRQLSTLLIIGLLFGAAVGSLVSILEYFSDREALRRFVLWGFGSLGGVSWQELLVMIPVLLFAMIWCMGLAKPLNALLLGQEFARGLGVPIRSIRFQIILTTALLAGTVTAFCGPIAFIGIAVPHLARIGLQSQQHGRLIPMTLLIGGCVLVFCDIIAQLPGSSVQLPINAITALLGAPMVIWIVYQYRNT
ncbi:MAG: iron ABC transporter permease [Bacteroidota bacterium]